MFIDFASRRIDLSRPHVMGILNVTPDSFSDGGLYLPKAKDTSKALARAEAMVNEGASFIDIGGESTRPGATLVSLQEEMDRVLPVLEAVAASLDCVISVDTSSPEIMLLAADLGAGLINDVRALQREGAVDAAAKTGLPVCLMHMSGQPKDMQAAPHYDDVVEEVHDFFQRRTKDCAASGIPREKLILDPGFGFGKTDAHNLTLLKNLDKIRVGGAPILVGLSRKSIIGRLLGRQMSERLSGSLSLAQYALQYGAKILRVHDVAPTMDIVKLHQALFQENV